MKKTLLKVTLCLLVIIGAGTIHTSAQALVYEGFDYTVPGYIGGNLGSTGSASNNWTTHSITGGQTTTIDLISDNLTYPGLQTSTGNRVYLFSNANATSRDVNRAFTTSNTVLYFSVLVKVIDNSQINTSGDYFLSFGSTSGSSAGSLGGRLGIRSVNTGANFRLCIQNTSTGTVTFTDFEQDLTFGTTYLAVVKYDRGVAPTVASLWVNPTSLGGSEPAGAVSNSSGTATVSAFASICLRNSTTTPKAELDEIRVGTSFADVTPVESDTQPPTPVFNPKNGDVLVPITVVPTITFNESVRKIDGTELVNGDLASLITFKKTNASGPDVIYTAVIDATKKIITITPSASLEKSSYYYIAVGAVEDNLGNESTQKSAIFSTESTGSISVIYPNGGEIMYSGELKTITWTTTNFAVGELVKVEVWAIDGGTGQYTWIELSPGTENDGSHQVTVSPDARYGTEYKIKLTGVTNLATDMSDAGFTVISTATTMASLRTYPASTIIRFDGEAIISFIRNNRNQKYLQDATGGLLIDDASAVLTTILAQGDKITGLEGQLGYFNGVLQLVPKKTTVSIVSTGNTITPVSLTFGNYLTNHLTYQSMLIKLSNVWFTAANGSATFAPATNYVLTNGTQNVEFRTYNADETDIDGYVIPSPHIDLIGIGGVYISTVQIYSRTIADMSILTGAESARDGDLLIYPVPASSVVNLKNIANVKSIEILDVTGKVVYRLDDISQNEIGIPVSNLTKGMYFIKLTIPGGRIVKRFIKS